MIKGRGKSICIFSCKGGVGKTITTLNLAGVFEHLEKKVLIVDFDLASGGISIALNAKSKKTIYNFADDYNNNRYSDFKDYIKKYDDYIDILPCPKDPRQSSKIDSKYLEDVIDKAVYNYDIVLIDTNHTLNELNLVTLDKVDQILFIMTNDPLNIKNMKSLITILKDTGIDKYKILLNNSIDPYKNYFSLYDIKNVIKANIDYVISSNFYIKNIDAYIMNGEIITLQNRMPSLFNKEYSTFMSYALEIIDKDDKKGASNDEKKLD